MRSKEKEGELYKFTEKNSEISQLEKKSILKKITLRQGNASKNFGASLSLSIYTKQASLLTHSKEYSQL